MSNKIGVIVHPGWTIHKDKLFDEYKDFVKKYQEVIIVPVLIDDYFAKQLLIKIPLKVNMDKVYSRYYNLGFVNNIINNLKTIYYKKYGRFKRKSKRKKNKRSYVLKVNKFLKKEKIINKLLQPPILPMVMKDVFNGTEYEEVYSNLITNLKAYNQNVKIYEIKVSYPNIAGNIIGQMIERDGSIDEVTFTGEYLNQCVTTVKNNFEKVSKVKTEIDDKYGVYYKGDINEV